MQRQRNAPLRSDWLESFIENKIWFYLLQTDFFCISENSCENYNFFLFLLGVPKDPRKIQGIGNAQAIKNSLAVTLSLVSR